MSKIYYISLLLYAKGSDVADSKTQSCGSTIKP